MSGYILNENPVFPPVTNAPSDAPIAMGGDLSAARLLEAYRNGIFPWYEDGQPILWWCPDPRFVLFPDELKISKSMRPLLNKNLFFFTVNQAFAAVVAGCKTTFRPGQEGNTWITEEVEAAYNNLHRLGYAHSAEAWLNGELVGGLYGIRLGNVFFGESMFSRKSNASKFAFIRYISQLKQERVALVDCQVYTEHLGSLGARMISREAFTQLLRKNI